MVDHEYDRRTISDEEALGPLRKLRVWHLIPCRFIGPLFAAIGVVFIFLSDGWPYYLSRIVGTVSLFVAFVGAILYLSSLLAPVAVYHERKQLPDDEDWYPSRWYYLMVFPDGLLGFVLAIVYTRRRRRYF